MTPTILLSFAHPDDESFRCGGLIAKYADAGVRVVLACATLGEAGKPGVPPLCTQAELPRVREQELRAACGALGVQDLHLLGYRDKELNQAPAAEVAARLADLVRQYRPQVVITFDPGGGGSHHPDHIAISRCTDLALAAAAPDWRVPRLLHTAIPAPWDLLARGEDPRQHPTTDVCIDTRPWAPRKAAALKAHRTQHLGIDRIFFADPDQVELRLSCETFTLVGPRRGPVLTDIFAGL